MPSANLVSELIKKKKMKGFHSKEHGAEEMRPEEAMEVSEEAEEYASPLKSAKTGPVGGKLKGMERVSPSELGTIKKVLPSSVVGTVKPMLSSENGIEVDAYLESTKGGSLLNKAKAVAEMAPKTEMEAVKHQKLMDSIKAYEEQLKKLQGK